MPEISDNRYQDLLASETNEKRLKEETANKTKALEEEKGKKIALKEKVESLETDLQEKETVISDKDKEILEKVGEIEKVTETAEKWTTHEESIVTARTESIETMKTTLADKFTDEHKTFIDWLPDEKVESFLKNLLPEDKKNPPSTDDGAGWDNPWGKDPDKFNEAAANSDLNWMLDALNTSSDT